MFNKYRIQYSIREKELWSLIHSVMKTLCKRLIPTIVLTIVLLMCVFLIKQKIQRQKVLV